MSSTQSFPSGLNADLDSLRALIHEAASKQQLTHDAPQNILAWLTDPCYAMYRDDVAAHIRDGRWAELNEAFWKVLEFGTGGRRGRMYPIGCNVINERTIGESAAGLAKYVREQDQGTVPLACALAYDTRHNSPEFAQLCARIMVAQGFIVYYLDDYRSTPELSFLVRQKNCACGIMVTASHNPPSDNAVKAYWSTGGQLVPPHDHAVIEQVRKVKEIDAGKSFKEGVRSGQIILCTAETDAAFVSAVVSQSHPGPRELKIIYTPLHGVGSSAVCPVLEANQFTDVEVFAPHANPDGAFPNVPDHVSNPENTAVFTGPIQRAIEVGADLVIGTDPDCDRLGCASPLSLIQSTEWTTFSGNQIAALLADYVMEQRRGSLTDKSFVVTTLVTTEMVRRIADSYGVRTENDLLVGFKWIAERIDQMGPEFYLLGTEESHGYMVGQHVRDKDGAVAAMLLSELAAKLKSEGHTLYEKLEALFWQHGYHAEQLLNQQMEGAAGMDRMKALMQQFRAGGLESLGGLQVLRTRDYLQGQSRDTGGKVEPLEGPCGDLVMIDLSATGNYVAVRPSGTEPKVKFYMFTYVAPEQLADLEMTADQMQQRMDAMQEDLVAFARQV